MKKDLNSQIETFMNSIPFMDTYNIRVTVTDHSTGFTSRDGKWFSVTQSMINELSGMVTGIQWWEEKKKKGKR